MQSDLSLDHRVVHVEKRLLCIPLLLVILRVWGTLQFFFSLAVSGTNHDGCIPHAVQTIFVILGLFQVTHFPIRLLCVCQKACASASNLLATMFSSNILCAACPPSMQAVGDPGQGWGNAILYIFLSPTIRHRLFTEPWNKCISVTEEKVGGLLESETESVYSRRSRSQRLAANGKKIDENEPLATAAGYKIRKYTTTTEASLTSPTDDISDNSCLEDQCARQAEKGANGRGE